MTILPLKKERFMNKKLFAQIKNEWQTNLWLAIELLLVSVVMWYVTDYLYTNASIYMEPRGFDADHCYLIEMGELNDKSPDYVPYTDNKQRSADVLTLLERLQQRPDVEAASLSANSYPYNGSNSSSWMKLADDTLTANNGWIVHRRVSPDFVRVFRYQGAKGETPEQLAEMLERNELLGSDNLFSHYGKALSEYNGQRFCINGDSGWTCRLGAALQNVRYTDFHQARGSKCIVTKLGWAANPEQELCVRVRPEHDQNFIERLKADSEKHFRIGNIYISNIRSFVDIRRNFQQAQYNQMRNYFTGMAFLLVNIFLGLLGTFWFRTQQRKSEIALHKAHGATNRMVFTRLFSEGWLLLLIITPLALAVDFNLAYAELNTWRNGTTLECDRFLICGGISFVLMALMIAIGIGIPASKAMKIEPAEALHNE